MAGIGSVEFYDADDGWPTAPRRTLDVQNREPDPTVDAPVPVRARFAAVRAWAPSALAGLAAVLALVMPWQTLLTLGRPDGSIGVFFSVDGWGRYPDRVGDPDAHGARYGILIYTAAALLLLAAAVPLYRQRRRRRAAPGTLIAVLLVAGSALLAGGTAAAALEVSSIADVYGSQTAFGGVNYPVDIGAMLWLGVAAVVLGLVAAVIPLLPSGRRPRREPDAELPPKDPPNDPPTNDAPVRAQPAGAVQFFLQPGDESLGR